MPVNKPELKSEREKLEQWLEDKTKQILSSVTPTIIIAGDFNARLGRPKGWYRNAEDAAKLPRNQNSPQSKGTTWLRRLAANFGLRTAHGANGHIAPATSKTASQQDPHELDYIFHHADQVEAAYPSDYDITPLSRKHCQRHRPVIASYKFCSSPPHTQSKRPRPPKNAATRIEIPDYGSKKEWTAPGEALRLAIPDLLETLQDPTKTPTECYLAITKLLSETAVKHLREDIQRPSSKRIRAYKGTGGHIHPAAANLFEEARQLHRKARNACSSAKKEHLGKRMSDGDFLREVEESKKMHKEAEATFRRAIGTAKSQRNRRRFKSFNELLTKNSRLFYKTAKSMASGFISTARQTIPPSNEGTPPEESFPKAFEEQFSTPQVDPPAISGPEAAFWQKHLPSPNNHQSCRLNINPSLIYNILYGASKGVNYVPCDAGCIECASIKRQDELHREGKAPKRGKLLPTSKAFQGDIPSELLCWFRCEDQEDTNELRLQICTALSLLFNRMLETGTPPTSFSHSVITLLLKEPKPGAVMDPSAYSSYRPISIIHVINKIFKLAATVRLSHFLVTHGIISQSQTGFSYKLSTEHSVFTLLHTIRTRARKGKPLHVLLIDILRAYDSVNHNALLLVLEKIGLEPSAVTLLRDILMNTTASLRVNGTTTDPIPIRVGVPQGDPLSCLLFNIFIESLARYLRESLNLNDTEITIDTIIHILLYADDLAVTAESREELQTILDLIDKWCTAWGFKINCGPGKSEAMFFSPTQQPLPPPLALTDDRRVNYVTKYRYLGWNLNTELDPSSPVPSLVEDTLSNKKIYSKLLNFAHRSTPFQILPIARRLQIRKTFLQAYLRSLQTPTPSLLKTLSNLNTSSIQQVLRYHKSSSYALAHTVAGAESSYAQVIRERFRLYNQLEFHPYRKRSLELPLPTAVRLFDVSLNSEEPSWSKESENLFRPYAHLLPYQTVHDWESHLGPRALAVAVTYFDFKKGVPHSPKVPTIPDHSHLTLNVRSDGSAKHVSYISFNMSAPPLLFKDPDGVPLSIQGPGCRSIISLAVQLSYPALVLAQLGTCALLYPPFTREAPNSSAPESDIPIPPPHDDSDPEPDDDDLDGDEDFRRFENPLNDMLPKTRLPPSEWNKSQKCPLCTSTIDSILHTALQCPHERMVEARIELIKSVKPMIRLLLKNILRTMPLDTRPDLPHAHVSALNSLHLDTAQPLDTPEGLAMIYRLLICAPWPLRAVPAGPASSLSAALGTYFDHCNGPNQAYRPLANDWCKWAESAIRKIARARTEACLQLAATNAAAPAEHV